MGPRALLTPSLLDFFSANGQLDDLVSLAAAGGRDAGRDRRRMVEALLDNLDPGELAQLAQSLTDDERFVDGVLAHGDPGELPIDRAMWDLAVSLTTGPGDGRLGADDARALFAQLDTDGVYPDVANRLTPARRRAAADASNQAADLSAST